MVNHAKKLPCGHIFHSACLRSWFQRQQTCPTCRLNILRTVPINPAPEMIQQQANNNAQPNENRNNQPGNIPNAEVNPVVSPIPTVIPTPPVPATIPTIPTIPIGNTGNYSVLIIILASMHI